MRLLIVATSSNLRLWLATGFIRSQLPGSNAIVIWRRSKRLRNTLGTVAVVRCAADARGTELRITLRSRNFEASFFAIWLALVFFLVLSSLIRSGANALPAVGALTLFIFTLGFAFIATSRLLGRDQGPALLDFIRQTTGAEGTPAELQPFGSTGEK